jgi:hypothetical protein
MAGDCILRQTMSMETEILQMALIGLRTQEAELERKIAEIRSRIKVHRIPPAAADRNPVQHRKHKISAAGRARIAAAQRRRWAVAKKKAA